MSLEDGKIHPRVVAKAESIEEDGFDRDMVQEVRFTVSKGGTITEVEAITDIGGPGIWVECLSGVVGGSWGGDTSRVPIFDDDAEQEVKEYGLREAQKMEDRIS